MPVGYTIRAIAYDAAGLPLKTDEHPMLGVFDVDGKLRRIFDHYLNVGYAYQPPSTPQVSTKHYVLSTDPNGAARLVNGQPIMKVDVFVYPPIVKHATPPPHWMTKAAKPVG